MQLVDLVACAVCCAVALDLAGNFFQLLSTATCCNRLKRSNSTVKYLRISSAPTGSNFITWCPPWWKGDAEYCSRYYVAQLPHTVLNNIFVRLRTKPLNENEHTLLHLAQAFQRVGSYNNLPKKPRTHRITKTSASLSVMKFCLSYSSLIANCTNVQKLVPFVELAPFVEIVFFSFF